MEESTWERHFLDRVQGIVRAHCRDRTSPLIHEVESTIGMVVQNWEPPDDSLWDIYRKLCLSAYAGKTREWLRMRLMYELLSAPVLVQAATRNVPRG